MELHEIAENTVDNVINRLRRTKLKSKENIGLIQVTTDENFPVYIGESCIRSTKDLKKDSVILSFNGLAEKMLEKTQEELNKKSEVEDEMVMEAYELYRTFKEKIKEIMDFAEMILFTKVFATNHTLKFIQKCTNGKFPTDESFLQELMPVIRSYAIENRQQMLQEALVQLKPTLESAATTFSQCMKEEIEKVREEAVKQRDSNEKTISNAGSLRSFKGNNDSKKSFGIPESVSGVMLDEKGLSHQKESYRSIMSEKKAESLRESKELPAKDEETVLKKGEMEDISRNQSQSSKSMKKEENEPVRGESMKSVKTVVTSKSVTKMEETKENSKNISQNDKMSQNTFQKVQNSRPESKETQNSRTRDQNPTSTRANETKSPKKTSSTQQPNSNRKNPEKSPPQFPTSEARAGWMGNSVHLSGVNQSNQHFLANSYFDPDFRPWPMVARPETSPASFRPESREISLMTDKMEIPSILINKEDGYDFFSPRIKECIGKEPVYSLMFRASRDGFGFASFHSLCDGMSPTLTIVKTKRARIFGGFASVPWGTGGVFQFDEHAFLFSWDLREFYEQTQNKEAAVFWGFDKNCPTFGLGSDLAIMADGDKNANSYLKMNGTFSSGETERNAISGGEYFELADYEVFVIKPLE